MEITLRVNINSVFDEVAQKSAYTAAKGADEEGKEFDRISTIDEDEPELMEFFKECRVELINKFASMLVLEDASNGYLLRVNAPDNFNSALLPSLEIALYDFFVYGILSRWCMYTKQDMAASYAEQSNAMLDGLFGRLVRRTYERKTRPF